MVNAANSTATAPWPGMPSASIVAIDPLSPLATAEFAAMTPFGLPLPKLALSFEARFVSA